MSMTVGEHDVVTKECSVEDVPGAEVDEGVLLAGMPGDGGESPVIFAIMFGSPDGGHGSYGSSIVADGSPGIVAPGLTNQVTPVQPAETVLVVNPVVPDPQVVVMTLQVEVVKDVGVVAPEGIETMMVSLQLVMGAQEDELLPDDVFSAESVLLGSVDGSSGSVPDGG